METYAEGSLQLISQGPPREAGDEALLFIVFRHWRIPSSASALLGLWVSLRSVMYALKAEALQGFASELEGASREGEGW